MKNVPLNGGKFAIVDDEDFDFVSRLKPTLHERTDHLGKNRKPGSTDNVRVVIDGAKHSLSHFLLRDVPGASRQTTLVVSHRNGDYLDFRMENLVLISRGVALHQGVKRKKTSSQYKGVYYYKGHKKPWHAAINGATHGPDYGKNRIYIGVFYTETAVALAYNEKARELYGDLAYQNNVD